MIKRDCYYYFVEQDMGAHIPCCALQAFLGGCPCNTEKSYDCTQYISRTDVDKLVEERLKNRRGDKE